MALHYTKETIERFRNPKFAGEIANPDGVATEGSPACLVAGSKIHANPDFKNIEELENGGKVLSHDGKYNEILKTFKRDYSGELITIKNQFGSVSLTPDHLVLAIKKPKEKIYNNAKYKKKLFSAWFCAEHLERRDIFLYPIPKVVENIEFLEIPQKKSMFDFKSRPIPEKVKITPELLELFGLYLAEGYQRKTTLGFALSITEKNLAEKINEISKSIFGIEAKTEERIKHNSQRVTINNTFLAKWIPRILGKGAENKQVPNELVNLNLELQKNLIKGLWEGDGYISLKRKKPRAEYSTISYKLVHQLKLLLLRQKIGCSIYTEKEKIVNGVKHRQSYRLHIGEIENVEKIAKILGIKFDKKALNHRFATYSWFDDNYYYAPIKSVIKSTFSGKVYNAEIANAHSYVTENLITHNCGDMITTYLKVNEKTHKIEEVKFRSFGCASNIATADVISEKAIGKTIDEVEKMDLATAARELGGLPPIKMHCSVLAVSALKAAIRDYKQKQGINVAEEKLGEEKIWDKLCQVINPEIGLNIVRLKMVKSVKADENGNVLVELKLGNTDEMFAKNISEEIEEHIKQLSGAKKVEVKVEK